MASRYAVRQQALASIGFASYDAYLASDLWKAIRTRILERDAGKCKLCDKPAYTAHHITYSKAVLSGNDDSQLASTCRGCHKHVEFDGDTKIVSTTDIAEKAFRRAIKQKGGRASKKVRQQTQPRCRCCLVQQRTLGRNDICMGCYRSGRALEFTSPSSRGPTYDSAASNRCVNDVMGTAGKPAESGCVLSQQSNAGERAKPTQPQGRKKSC